MNKNLIFSPKAQYVTPSFKSVVLDARATMMQAGSVNKYGLQDIEGEDVNDNSSRWGR